MYFEGGYLLTNSSTISNNAASGSGSAGGGFYVKSGTMQSNITTISGNVSEVFGGGMYLETDQVVCTLNSTTLTGNSCTNGAGGGIYINQGTVNLVDHCKVTSNDANYVDQHGHGGGIYLYQGTLNTTRTLFSQNTADIWGGGLFLHDGQGSWVSDRDTLLSNAADQGGGGFMAYNGTASMSGSKIASNTSPRKGAGAYLFLPANSCLFTSCLFESNVTSNGPVNDVNQGGAMFVDSATVDIAACRFVSNKATRTDSNSPKGGAIYMFKGTLNLTNTDFSLNQTNTVQGRGGAIFIDYGKISTYSTCRFTGNTSGRSGGALFVFRPGAIASLSNTIFSSNQAGKLGGGVYMENGTLTQDSCAYLNNTVGGIASPGGGGFNHNSGTSTTTNTYFTGNSAEGGGAVYFKTGSASFTNVQMTGNTASGYGGAIFTEASGAALTVNNGTIYGNTATTSGGGIANQGSASIALNNCVIWGNSTSGIANQIGNQVATAIQINHSCYQNGANDVIGNTTPVQSIHTDPLFVNAAGGDYRLQATSPCLDKGNNSYNSQAYDIRGQVADMRGLMAGEYARKVSKITGLAGTIDMGAYEFNHSDCTGSPSAPTAMGSTICYLGKDTLRVTGITGMAGWYSAASGGTRLGGDTLLIIDVTSGMSTTTYYVQDSTICGASTRTAVTLTVNTGLSVSVNSPTICSGDDNVPLTATVTPAGSYTYAWSAPAGEAAPAGLQTILVDAGGAYTVTVTSGNGCTGTAIGNVTLVGGEVKVPVIETVVQPTCQPLINGQCGLSSLPSGNWTLYIEGTTTTSVNGSGPTYQVANLPQGVYRFWVVTQEGCASDKTSPFGAVLVTY